MPTNSTASALPSSPLSRSYHDLMLSHNPHCKLMNNQRGYLVCEVGRDTWLSEMKVVDQVERPGGALSTRARFAVERGRPGLKPA